MSSLTPIQSQEQEIQLTRDSTPLTTEKSSDKKMTLVQKGKYNQKKSHSRFTSSPNVKKSRNIIKTENQKRKDYYGTLICKSNKRKVHLVFIDEISDKSLIDIIEIESIKKYNIVPFIKGGKDVYIKSHTCCSCFIF